MSTDEALELSKKYLREWLKKNKGKFPMNVSPYRQPGGVLGCLYCGGKHSTGIECRLPCTYFYGCSSLGIPWNTADGPTAPLCYEHRPRDGKPLPVPQPIPLTDRDKNDGGST
jgi:hypothetical protein